MTAVEPATGTPSRPSRRVSWVALGVAVVLAGFFVILAIAKPDEGDQLGPQVKNFAAPTLVTETIDGTPFDLSQHRGRWVVLNFIASWCVPCKQEHPELVAFVAQQRQLGADGAELFAVITQDDVANVRRFFADNGGDWPVLRDDDGAIAVSLGQTRPPESWVIDPAGTVRLRFVGAVTAAGLSEAIQRLRAGQDP